jgi:hypothetical protein
MISMFTSEDGFEGRAGSVRPGNGRGEGGAVGDGAMTVRPGQYLTPQFKTSTRAAGQAMFPDAVPTPRAGQR